MDVSLLQADGVFFSLPDSLTPHFPLLPRGSFSQQTHPPTRGLLAKLPSVASLPGIPCFTAAWLARDCGGQGGAQGDALCSEPALCHAGDGLEPGYKGGCNHEPREDN